MRIWVVIQGIYDGERIVGRYTSRLEAEKHVATSTETWPPHIEEWYVNERFVGFEEDGFLSNEARRDGDLPKPIWVAAFHDENAGLFLTGPFPNREAAERHNAVATEHEPTVRPHWVQVVRLP